MKKIFILLTFTACFQIANGKPLIHKEMKIVPTSIHDLANVEACMDLYNSDSATLESWYNDAAHQSI